MLVALAGCNLTGTSSTTRPARSSQGQSAASAEPALAPPVPGSYAALGASETYGVGAQPHTRGYAYLVAHRLGAKHFLNEGIPGATIDAAYQPELTNALAVRPALCTVFFGFNDLAAGVSRGAFLRNLHDLVVTLRRVRARVLIIGLPDLTKVPAAAGRLAGLRQTLQSWNRGMRQVAQQTGARFLDLHAFAAELAAHPEYIGTDGLHPSNAGHARLAQVVVAAVRADHLWSSR